MIEKPKIDNTKPSPERPHFFKGKYRSKGFMKGYARGRQSVIKDTINHPDHQHVEHVVRALSGKKHDSF